MEKQQTKTIELNGWESHMIHSDLQVIKREFEHVSFEYGRRYEVRLCQFYNKMTRETDYQIVYRNKRIFKQARILTIIE
jgi:hypothetical protein